MFSEYKKELLNRRKRTAADQLKDSASKVMLGSSLYERGVDVSSPIKYQRDQDDEVGSSFLTALLDDGVNLDTKVSTRPKPVMEYSSPLRNGQWHKSSTNPAIQSALSGPTTRLQSVTDRRALRLALMARVEQLNSEGRTRGSPEDETIEAKESRIETNEEYRRRVSAFTHCQSKDFKIRYAPPKGCSNDEQVSVVR